jgi:hypothetical protein
MSWQGSILNADAGAHGLRLHLLYELCDASCANDHVVGRARL